MTLHLITRELHIFCVFYIYCTICSTTYCDVLHLKLQIEAVKLPFLVSYCSAWWQLL